MATRGDLKKSLLDWMEWFRKFSRELVPRRDIPNFQQGLCLALTGVRRSGKTSLAVQVAKDLGLIDHSFYCYWFVIPAAQFRNCNEYQWTGD